MLGSMLPHRENIQTFAAMFEGYWQAVRRFHGAAKTRDPTATFVPLFEALNWAVSLDERAAKHWTPDGEPAGWAWRKRVRDAELLRGVRFVRNSVHHDWSDALALDERGRAYPKTFPVVYFEWRWRAASELPERDRKDTDGEVIYRERLEHQPARLTLEALGWVFFFLYHDLEPLSAFLAPTPVHLHGAPGCALINE
jgi:hypothetical protein